MSNPLPSGLPNGTKIDIAVGEDGCPVIMLRLRTRGGPRRRREVLVVASSSEMRALGALLIRQADILDCAIPFTLLEGGRR